MVGGSSSVHVSEASIAANTTRAASTTEGHLGSAR